MKLELYRRHEIGLLVITEDKPEIVYHNVSWFEIKSGYIIGNVEGEELTINVDMRNYNYRISADL